MGRTPAFPDASIDGNAKQNRDSFNQISSEKNIELALKTVVSSGVKSIPGVSALLRRLVLALWPNPDKNKGLV